MQTWIRGGLHEGGWLSCVLHYFEEGGGFREIQSKDVWEIKGGLHERVRYIFQAHVVPTGLPGLRLDLKFMHNNL